MKNKYLLLNIVILVLGVVVFLPTKNDDEGRKYQPREQKEAKYSAQGAQEYLNRIRANQETGKIDIKDVKTAQNQMTTMPQRKSGTNPWKFRGPDNIGGRTRALLIDKDNSSIMYAGGVAGGLWKSESAGQYWKQIKYEGHADEIENLNVSCITQTSNGYLYFGTGEGFYHRTGTGTGGFIGDGIWRSVDGGETFVKLESTLVDGNNNDFSVVYELAADPSSENTLYAATQGGLMVSNNGGDSWTLVELSSGINTFVAYDVAVNEVGLVVASLANKCYVKKPSSNVFELRSGKDDSEGGNLISNINIGRLEFAMATTDPDYIYCSAVTPYGTLRNLYQSKDGGDSWVTIGKGGSSFFNPFRDQGVYDNVIAVDETDKNKVYVGGIDLYEGKAVASGNLFDWTQISYSFIDYWENNYIHADLHCIVFDKKKPGTFFIGSDGGISRAFIDYEGKPYLFKVMNLGYGVTQYYSVAANSLGHLIGGSQDNGSMVIDGKGNSIKSAKEVYGGDGGHVAISDIVPTANFVTMYYGGLWRNIDKNYSDYNDFYVTDIIDLHWATEGGYLGSGSPSNEGSFVTPIAYWETDDDEFGKDTVHFIARKEYEVGEKVVFNSANLFGAPIDYEVGVNYEKPEYGDSIGFKKNDTIKYYDPYGSLFALGMARTVWMTRKAASFVNPTNEEWFQAVKFGVFVGSTADPNAEGMEKTTQLVFSNDGDNLFIATDYGFVYRLSNLKHARDKSTACAKANEEDIVTTITKIAGFGNRAITGLATDPNDPNNLVVTLGNYGNSAFVYLCVNATKVGQNSGTDNMLDITDNLPKAPAYCALVEQTENAGRVLVGTELGVFIAENVFTQASSTLNWTPFNEGLDPVAVFQIDQSLTTKWTKDKGGMIYIGTHGQGFFENDDFLFPYVGVDDVEPVVALDGSKIETNIYPNPVSDMANVNYVIPEDANVKMYLYNMNGQLIRTIDGGSQMAGTENTLQIQMNALPRGTYLLNVVAGQAQSTERIIKN